MADADSRSAHTATTANRPLLLIVAGAMALFLNHSGVVGGVNLSLADPLMLVVLLGLLATGHLKTPLPAMIFYCAVVVIGGLTAAVLTPEIFGTYASDAIFTDIVKLTVSLSFLLVGYNLARLGLYVPVLRCFAVGTAAVALLGVMMELTGTKLFPEVFYYAGIRFRGFMVDPNYWAVVASSAIAFVLYDRRLRISLRLLLVLVLAASVFISGSKTGLITLFVVCVVVLLRRAGDSKNRTLWILLICALTFVVAFAWEGILRAAQSVIDRYVTALPQLERVSILIKDPLGAISDGGSARATTWDSGFAMIDRSPIVGVGIGSYRSVNGALFGETTVAHNTYLQLAAEWGIPLAVAFFVAILVILHRVSRRGSAATETYGVAARNMVIAFLVGSISLSLNNARMFWLFLGVITFIALERQANRGYNAAGVDADDKAHVQTPGSEVAK